MEELAIGWSGQGLVEIGKPTNIGVIGLVSEGRLVETVGGISFQST